MDGLERRSDGNAIALHTIPGSQPEEQVKKEAGDPVRSIIRAKEIDVSSRDGVAGSGFGAKLVCEAGKGKVERDDWIAVGVATGGARGAGVVCNARVSGPWVWGEELGVENVVFFKLS